MKEEKKGNASNLRAISSDKREKAAAILVVRQMESTVNFGIPRNSNNTTPGIELNEYETKKS